MYGSRYECSPEYQLNLSLVQIQRDSTSVNIMKVGTAASSLAQLPSPQLRNFQSSNEFIPQLQMQTIRQESWSAWANDGQVESNVLFPRSPGIQSFIHQSSIISAFPSISYSPQEIPIIYFPSSNEHEHQEFSTSPHSFIHVSPVHYSPQPDYTCDNIDNGYYYPVNDCSIQQHGSHEYESPYSSPPIPYSKRFSSCFRSSSPLSRVSRTFIKEKERRRSWNAELSRTPVRNELGGIPSLMCLPDFFVDTVPRVTIRTLQRPIPPPIPEKLYHYTTEDGAYGIIKDQCFKHIEQAGEGCGKTNRFGVGIYFTNITPESKTEAILLNNYGTGKFFLSQINRTEFCFEFLSALLPKLVICQDFSCFNETTGKRRRYIWMCKVPQLDIRKLKGKYYVREINGFDIPKSIKEFPL